MSYVMGHDLNRDQIDRFKSVLGRKRRLEHLLTDPRLMLYTSYER
jgi:hypothetical protein